MLIDSTGLGYTIRSGEILVHYPTHRAVDAERTHSDTTTNSRDGVGWPIGPIPASYALDPPNAITAERMRLWEELRNGRE